MITIWANLRRNADKAKIRIRFVNFERRIYIVIEMRIFLAGGSGIIGLKLIPLLLDNGHTVIAMTRSAQKIPVLLHLGATPLLCDVFDKSQFMNSIIAFEPDLLIDQLTALPDNPEQIQEHSDFNNRIRTEGIDNVIEACSKAASAPRLIAQSVAWTLPGNGGKAIRHLESRVLEYGGLVLRYGRFYGSNTYFENDIPPNPRIHIDDAARQTLYHLSSTLGIIDITEHSMD